MARNPKQDANLVKFTEKTASEMGKRGNKKSQRTRKALKTFKEVAIADLTEEDQKVSLKAVRNAMRRGYLPAIEFYLKLIGQHPDQNMMVNDEDTGVILLPPVMEETDEKCCLAATAEADGSHGSPGV